MQSILALATEGAPTGWMSLRDGCGSKGGSLSQHRESDRHKMSESEIGRADEQPGSSGKPDLDASAGRSDREGLEPGPIVETDVTMALPPWFALRVRPNYEKPVSAALRGKGFQEFLPLVRSRRQWSDRVKVMDLPLFPGYLFCRLNLDDRMPLLTTPGFLYLVGVGKNPEPVDQSEIEAIQSVLRSGLPVTRWPSLMVGQKVRLKHGPLRGLEGVLTKIANQHRIYVSVTLLKRSISVEVAPEWIHPLDASSEPESGSKNPAATEISLRRI
jgi:transcription antitermination factor NusG